MCLVWGHEEYGKEFLWALYFFVRATNLACTFWTKFGNDEPVWVPKRKQRPLYKHQPHQKKRTGRLSRSNLISKFYNTPFSSITTWRYQRQLCSCNAKVLRNSVVVLVTSRTFQTFRLVPTKQSENWNRWHHGWAQANHIHGFSCCPIISIWLRVTDFTLHPVGARGDIPRIFGTVGAVGKPFWTG